MHCPIKEEEMETRRRRENTEHCRVLGVLEEMKVFYSDTMTGWRGAITEWEATIDECPPGGRNQQLQSTTDIGNRELVLFSLTLVLQI